MVDLTVVASASDVGAVVVVVAAGALELAVGALATSGADTVAALVST